MRVSNLGDPVVGRHPFLLRLNWHFWGPCHPRTRDIPELHQFLLPLFPPKLTCPGAHPCGLVLCWSMRGAMYTFMERFKACPTA